MSDSPTLPLPLRLKLEGIELLRLQVQQLLLMGCEPKEILAAVADEIVHCQGGLDERPTD